MVLVSAIYAMDNANLPEFLVRVLPLYNEGYGRTCMTLVLPAVSTAVGTVINKKQKNASKNNTSEK